ncbi:MAG: S8 family serine peptidase [Phaeodactylibacter sp.]|nr:S8 family serine peptidase [Phaeodactylibacter sp.]MCB9050602.1 S8 family serine peptidase [Lewinellaceae bacterium]
MIYPLAFSGAVASLALWFLYRTNDAKGKLFQTTFFGALGIYALSVLLSDASLGAKLGILFRDLMAMTAFGLVFQAAAAHQRWLVPVSIAALAGLVGYYQGFMAHSFSSGSSEIQGLAAVYDPSSELLVELAEGTGEDALATVARKYELKMERAFTPAFPEATELDDYFAVDVPPQFSGNLDEIIRELQNISSVDWVEPNETVSVAPQPGNPPPGVNKRFGINDPGLGQLWGFDAMEVDKLFDYMASNSLSPKRKALIAILDTGVDAQHEDIKDNFHSTKPAYDDDPKGHGTHCAGIAAAVSNNGVGVASFSRDNSFVEVTSIKVLSASGMGSQRTIIKGILEAADAGVDVISLSLGGFSNQTKERAYQKAVDYANEKGAIVVAAAGNSNRDAKGFAPAGVPGVIAVSALDEELNRAGFSNYVTNLEMGIAAPGVNIYSTIPNGRYDTFNGTSMATPYVSGLIGLLKSLDPELDTQGAYRILHKSGKKVKNTKETGRLIFPLGALKELNQQNQKPL